MQLAISSGFRTGHHAKVALRHDCKTQHTSALIAIEVDDDIGAAPGITKGLARAANEIDRMLQRFSDLWSHWACLPLLHHEMAISRVAV